MALLAFLLAKWWYEKEDRRRDVSEETRVIVQSIQNMSKLIVSEGVFSEIYTYKDAKGYFYDTFEFEKSAVVTVTAKVQVVFDFSKMQVEVDSVQKKIRIKYIPEEEIVVIPDVKYYDLKQSTFNTFSQEELNRIQKKSIERIRETAQVTQLKKEARQRLIDELKNIYRLSAVMGWEVTDETETGLLDNFIKIEPES